VVAASAEPKGPAEISRRRLTLSFLNHWVERRGPDPAVTTFTGWDDVAGIAPAVVGAGAALALCGWGSLLPVLAGGAGTAAGFRHHLVIAPLGIRYRRTWWRVRWRELRLPLDAPVVVRSTFEDPDGDGVAIGEGETVTIPAPVGEAHVLRQALLDAIARARPK
jgi:hypothetical protein